MKFVIKHEIRGRLRIHLYQREMSIRQADLLQYYLCIQTGVCEVKIYERTADAAIYHDGKREEILKALCRFSYGDERLNEMVPKNSGRALNREYREKLIQKITVRAFAKLFLPISFRAFYTVVQSVRYLVKGLGCLAGGKLEVEV